MENNQDFEKDQEEFTQQELEQEVLWMRALLELEEKEIPLPESLRSEHLLEKRRRRKSPSRIRRRRQRIRERSSFLS